MNPRILKGAGGGGLLGGKGGASSGGGGAQEDPNTLQATVLANVLDVVSEGEIVGLVNGAQSIFFNNTPLQNPDGTFNFKGVTWHQNFGTPGQDYLPGFSDVETEFSVSTQVKHSAPVIRTIWDSVDALRIKINVPRLTYQDPGTGNLHGSSVNLRFFVQPNGGSYQEYYFSSAFANTSSPTATTTAISILVQTVQTTPVGFGLPQWKGRVRYRVHGTSTWTNSEERVFNQNETTQFDFSGLASNSYDFEATEGSIISSQALAPSSTVITGKTTSAYEASFVVPLVGSAPFLVKVQRDSVDADLSTTFNETFWASYTEITYIKLSYPDVALVGLQVNSQLFGSDVPTRSYEIKGIKVKIPSNYNPVTRVYTGIWDGSFTTAWTDNPAWIVYDLLTSFRYGLGKFIAESQVDKFALYDIAQYNDGIVNDGFGGQEPRFRFNGVLNTLDDAYKCLNQVCASFNTMIYWGNGTVTFVQDSPKDASKIVAMANVLHGEFQYQGSSLKARHTVVNVTWYDPNNSYKPTILVVEDPSGIDRYGWRVASVVAYGCITKGQAWRCGKWILETEQNETEIVTYTAGMDHSDVRPGDILAIADSNYAGARFEGRFVATTTDDFILDKNVTLNSGLTYQLTSVLPDGTVEVQNVSNAPGVTSTITLSSPYTQIPLIGGMWVITSTAATYRTFRVISIKEGSKSTYDVSALFHDSAKYARIEQNINLTPPPYTFFPTGPLAVPTNITYQEYLYLDGITAKSGITISWTPSNDSRVNSYQVQVKDPTQSKYYNFAIVQGASVLYQGTFPGNWSFQVLALDGIGGQSQPLQLMANLVGLYEIPQDVDNFFMQVVDGAAHLSWTPNPELNLDHYDIKFSTVTDGSATWASSIEIISASRTSNGITVPLMIGTYLIKAITQQSIESVNADVIISTVSQIVGQNSIITLTEDPNFTGSKLGVAQVDHTLQLDFSTYIDSIGLVDSILDWDSFDGELDSTGTYYFHNSFDLGEKYTARLTASITVTGINVFNKIDSWSDIDSVTSWDGNIDPTSWGITLQVRTTNTDPNDTEVVWTEWQNFYIGDYSARAFQFRVLFVSDLAGISPYMTKLSVQFTMGDRVESGNGIICPNTGKSITYTLPFRALPSIGITGEALQVGDYFTITSATTSGFIISFYNILGTQVQRTFNYNALGYGAQVS